MLGTCEHTRLLNYETNVLVPVRIGELQLISSINVFFSMWAVINFGINVVCFVINWIGVEPAVSDRVFHVLEFTASFIFAVIQLLAVFYSYDRSDMCKRPIILKTVVFVNIAGALIPMMLVILNLDMFEVASHEIEYANAFFQGLVDALMFTQIIKANYELKQRGKVCTHSHRFESSVGALSNAIALLARRSQLAMNLIIAIVPALIAITMILVYNAPGFDGSEAKGEQASHFLEFAFEMISSGESLRRLPQNINIPNESLRSSRTPQSSRSPSAWTTRSEPTVSQR